MEVPFPGVRLFRLTFTTNNTIGSALWRWRDIVYAVNILRVEELYPKLKRT